tara:strand:- start:50 stop:205 length:156 start_codon:yes stop_codon:yes gene_type:complete
VALFYPGALEPKVDVDLTMKSFAGALNDSFCPQMVLFPFVIAGLEYEINPP